MSTDRAMARMSRRDIDATHFGEALAERGLSSKLNTIDELVRIADEAGCWTPKFYERIMLSAKKSAMRRLQRYGYEDEAGRVIRCLGIEETDPVTGQVRRGYKQLRFFTEDNWEYAVREARRELDSVERKYVAICTLAIRQCGEEFQKRFEFELPVNNSIDPDEALDEAADLEEEEEAEDE